MSLIDNTNIYKYVINLILHFKLFIYHMSWVKFIMIHLPSSFLFEKLLNLLSINRLNDLLTFPIFYLNYKILLKKAH
jgi:hypothetical protein